MDLELKHSRFLCMTVHSRRPMAEFTMVYTRVSCHFWYARLCVWIWSQIHQNCLSPQFFLDPELQLAAARRRLNPERGFTFLKYIEVHYIYLTWFNYVMFLCAFWGLPSGKFFGTHQVGRPPCGTWGWIRISAFKSLAAESFGIIWIYWTDIKNTVLYGIMRYYTVLYGIIRYYTVLYGIRYTSNYVNRCAIEASPLCMQFTRVAQACRIGRIRRHLWHASDVIPNLRQHRAQWRFPDWIRGDGHSSHPDPRGHRYVQHHKVGDPMASRKTCQHRSTASYSWLQVTQCNGMFTSERKNWRSGNHLWNNHLWSICHNTPNYIHIEMRCLTD